MPEVLVSIAYEGLAVMTIYFGLFLWYFDEAVLPKVLFKAGLVELRVGRGPLPAWRRAVGHAVLNMPALAWST